MTPDWSDLFWSKVHPEALSGCWLWHGATTSHGYGTLSRSSAGKVSRAYAHRVAYERATGAAPGALDVCHRCDVPSCVNPDHLFLGTARDNAADMVRKGRARHKAFPGETHHGHILSERQVLEIRQRRGESARALAAEYGVQRWTVYDILSRRSWRHV